MIYVVNQTDEMSLADAIAQVVNLGTGTITRFMRIRNNPNCSPEFIYKCCSAWGYENGCWHGIDLYYGHRIPNCYPAE